MSCLFANRAYVPIGSCTPIQRLDNIVKQTKSSLIITDEKINLDNVEICNIKTLEKYSQNNYFNISNEIAYIIFTSGSTGVPKGVPISKTNLENFINWISNVNPLNQYKNINVLNQASFRF